MSRLLWSFGLTAVLLWAGCSQDQKTETASGTGQQDNGPADESLYESGNAGGVDLGSAAPMPGTKGEDASQASSPTTQGAPSQAAIVDGVDLSYIKADDSLVLFVRPGQILGNSLVQQILGKVSETLPEQNLAPKLKEMNERLGFDATEIDYVLLSASSEQIQSFPAMFMMQMMGGPMGPGPEPVIEPEVQENCDDPSAAGNAPGPDAVLVPGAGPGFGPPPLPLLVVKLKKNIDQDKFLSNNPGAEAATYKEKTYYMQGFGAALYFADESTVLFATEDRIKSMIDGERGTPGTVTELIRPLLSREFALVINVKPFQMMIGEITKQNPMAAAFGAYVKQVDALTLSLDLTGPNLLTAQLQTIQESSAQGLQGMLDTFLLQGKQKFTQSKEAMTEIEKTLLPILDPLVNETNVIAEGKNVNFAVPRPKNLEQLPGLLEPFLAEAKKMAEIQGRQNKMRQIALAFHIYFNKHDCLPNHDRPGQPEDAPAGLSWRVHLLPFLEQEELYNQFHLDEPWDSEHNKTLIKQMPEVYGKDPEGKTRFHLFLGAETPFGGEKAATFLEITDGTSFTIMFVEAGPNKADIWTKPGGLEFNPDDPISTLGDIGEFFLVCLMDGSVHRLEKTIDKATLNNLIRHQDGKPVNFP